MMRYVRTEALKLLGPDGLARVRIHGDRPTLGMGSRAVARPETTGAGQEGGVAASLSSAGPAHSSTNIQESGVDEPDVVKSDGRVLAVAQGTRISLLSIQPGQLAVRSTIDVAFSKGLFLASDRLIHIGSMTKSAHADPSVAGGRGWTKVSVFDIRDPSAPKTLSTAEMEGDFAAARMSAGVIRLVLNSGYLGPDLATPQDSSEGSRAGTLQTNTGLIRRSMIGSWLPHYEHSKAGRATATGHLHEWESVSRPPEGSGVAMVTVVNIDPVDGAPFASKSVIGAGEIVYASLDHLYVTSNSSHDFLAIRGGRAPSGPMTRIHRFDLTDQRSLEYSGSGHVPGFLLNQFSMSEHEGRLRVASTLGVGIAAAASAVTVLEPREGALVPIGSVGQLGIGETIRSVRFIGDKAYVVTFRATDPLYVIDLRDPKTPRVAGELKILGYSGYLHPLADGALLGVGRDATEEGFLKGLQLSRFDVTDPASPRLSHKLVFGEHGRSPVEEEHHALMYWAPRDLVVMPAYISNGEQAFSGVLAVKVTSEGLNELGRVKHGDGEMIDRAVVVGDSLLTISTKGVLMSSLDTFGDQAWAPLS